MSLPRGYLQVAIQKIPNEYAQTFLYIVDFRPIKKEPILLPEKTKEHYLFSLVKEIDEHIFNKTNYKHYGFLPMKMAALLQMAARYNSGFPNNFHIGLTGAKSSGKSQFAKYWGITLYAENCLATSATSISIPKLRGTMESFHLFSKEHRFQYRGLLGEKDLIVIDELKENPEVKNNLKIYLLETNYDYSKAGGSTQTHKRNAHVIITQNVDTGHLDRLAKETKKIYQSDDLRHINEEDNEPKPAWDSKIDLTLGLNHYKNPFLRYAIKKIRDEFSRNEINWIDGSELALKQRFPFYFFLGTKKYSKELDDLIKETSTLNVIEDNTEITKIMDPSLLRKFFHSLEEFNNGTNDLEYFDKVDNLLNSYGKLNDARTKKIMYAMIKLIRIIDKRNYCTDKDLEIFQFILEFLDNKVEIVDTNEYKIHGPNIDNTKEDIIEEGSEMGGWHDGGLDEFDE